MKIIGWFQGAAEFGPRALGNRSILCKPYPAEMKDYLNNQVKFRESFRPFAPAILSEYQKDFFEINQDSFHMLIASKVKEDKKGTIPAVVHVDRSARVQTVNENSNKKFYNLLKEFNNLTNIPVLLNTSFNVKGQPIVNNPRDAIETFKKTKIDVLSIGNFLLKKELMKLKLNKNKSFIVAEIGWNFLGDINLAKKMILSAKRSGADAVKFQIWNPKNLKKGSWDKDGRRKLYEKSFLDKKKYKSLYDFSKKNNICCFASVWSSKDLKILSSVSKEIVKIPSPEAYNLDLIKEALKVFKKKWSYPWVV